MAKANKLSLRIRMYRQGLGDCFLLTFTRKNKDDFNVMIDCGLLQGTTNGKEIMQAVVENIEETLTVTRAIDGDTKKWLDVVVLTHEHIDHISGFSQAQALFDRIHFGEVWAGWMDDEHHPKYKAVRERFHKQVTGLTAALNKMNAPAHDGLKETIGTLVNEFFDAQVLGAQGGRSPAWDYALKKSVANPRYCSPGQLFQIDGLDDVRIYILGPPENYETFTKVDPPQDETYRSEGNSFALADSFFAAVAGDDSLFEAELYQPFENHLRIAPEEAKKNASLTNFFQAHYGFEADDENEWRRIDDDWLTMAGELALNLDSYTNNTCLAFAIEFISSKKVLLFPGDAQFANWISWQKLTWEAQDDGGTKQKVTTEDLLKRTIFYKVGHHGSHNATLKKHGLEMMKHPDLMAMIPVDREKAKSKTSKSNPKGWEMPEKNLFDRLQERTRGRVVLADESDKTDLQVRCQDQKFISRVTFQSPPTLVRDNAVSSQKEPLYVEVTIES